MLGLLPRAPVVRVEGAVESAVRRRWRGLLAGEQRGVRGVPRTRVPEALVHLVGAVTTTLHLQDDEDDEDDGDERAGDHTDDERCVLPRLGSDAALPILEEIMSLKC